MYTCCPQCNTRYWVTNLQLDEDEGYIHCSHCYTTFNASLSLTDTLPEHVKQANVLGISAATQSKQSDDMNEDYQTLTKYPPTNIHKQQHSPPVSLWRVMGILLLMIVFMGQYTYFMRDNLAQHIQLRPWIETLCVHAKCKLALMSQPEKIEIIRRSFLSHPYTKNALFINATIINKATFIQSFPILNLKFSDLSGAIVAQRNFHANEYLHDDIDIKAGMPSDTPVWINLEIIDPGSKAINYEFSFI